MSASWASKIDKLNDNNYKDWRLAVRTILLHNNLWQYVSGERKKPEAEPDRSNSQEILDWQQDDEKAMATILIAVRKKQVGHISNCKSAREAWLKLQEVHRHSGQSKKKLCDVPFDEVFLGSLVYEWIRRIIYYTDFRLSDLIIASMANHFKAHLQIDWFCPNKFWINAFRQKYNLQDCSTKNLSIGYNEPLSANIRDICKHMIPLWKANKIPEITSTQVRMSNQIPGLGSTALTSTQVQVVTPVTNAEAATIPYEPFPRPSTIVIEPLRIGAISKVIETAKEPLDEKSHSPIIEVIKIPDDDENDIESIKEKLAENGVKISRETVDFEDRLPKIFCTVSGSTTIHPVEKTETEPIFKDYPIDLESYIPKAVCCLPEKTAENTNNKVRLRNLKRKDTSMVEKNLSVTKKTKGDRKSQQPLIPQKFTTKRRLGTQQEAFRCIKLLEDFAMIKENFRLIGLIERLETVMKKSV